MPDFPLNNAFDQDEADRAQLWRDQRAARIAYRQRVQASLEGDPLAAWEAQGRVQAWLDYWSDMSIPPEPDDDPDTIPVTNQDVNYS
jgi:hypothetical protein